MGVDGLVQFLHDRFIRPRLKLEQEIHDAEVEERTWAAAWRLLGWWNKPDWPSWEKANNAIKGGRDCSISKLQSLRDQRGTLVTTPFPDRAH